MSWNLVSLDGFIAHGEPCRENVERDLMVRPLNDEDIDEFTPTRAMKATMTVTNYTDLRFEVICEAQDIDNAKQMLVLLINKETQSRYERQQKIAAFMEN